MACGVRVRSGALVLARAQEWTSTLRVQRGPVDRRARLLRGHMSFVPTRSVTYLVVVVCIAGIVWNLSRLLPPLQALPWKGEIGPRRAAEKTPPRRRLQLKPALLEHRPGGRRRPTGRRPARCTCECAVAVGVRGAARARRTVEIRGDIGASISLRHVVRSARSLRILASQQSTGNRMHDLRFVRRFRWRTAAPPEDILLFPG